jgi:hypothetical protein
MQVRRLSEPRDFEIIAPSIVAFSYVKRLMKVADDVDDKSQRHCQKECTASDG